VKKKQLIKPSAKFVWKLKPGVRFEKQGLKFMYNLIMEEQVFSGSKKTRFLP
jgi:hypothetical protein